MARLWPGYGYGYGYAIAIAIAIAMVVFVAVARRLCESEVHERSEWDSCLSYCA